MGSRRDPIHPDGPSRADASETLEAPRPRAPAAPPPLALPPRYEDRGLLAFGGMGEVRRVWDRVLERGLVMKLIRGSVGLSPRASARFLREARITAKLQHPGIVQIHDSGTLPDGRHWYTMPEVNGRTFREHLQRALAGEPDRLSLTRLVASFEQACQAVAFAHAAGVLHLDLKPENLMIGAFGEVLVLDWGIARRVGAAPDPGARVGGEPHPRHTAVAGTLRYMAPERLADAALDPRSDVFSLGVILGELLDCGAQEASQLAELAAAATAKDPAARPADAGAFAATLRAWLDGMLKRDLARRVVAQADALAPEVDRLRARATALGDAAAAQLRALPPHAPAADKQPAWRLEREAQALSREAAVLELTWLQHLRAALSHDPDCDEALARLADHHQAAMAEAEARRDQESAARHELLLRTHDRGRHRGWLQGDGAISLRFDPPDTAARLYRVVEVDRRLEPVFEEDLGVGPLVDRPLARGAWLLELRAPGRETLRYPVQLGRGERWDAIPPGEPGALPVRLPPAGALAPEEIWVPGGWFQSGGDPDAPDSLSRRRLWLDDFVISRDPVTVGEYLAFLEDLLSQGRRAEALARAPAEPLGRIEGNRPVFELGPDGHFRGNGVTDNRWDLDCPVTLVDWWSATAYAAWLAARTGRPWRLLHDQEWEKAGRGVDGRLLPWGDTFDPSWAAMLHSHPGAPSRVPVSAFPGDLSPYGVRGLAGNCRDWCYNAYDREGPADGSRVLAREAPADAPHRMLRGGSWSTARPAWCRLAARFANAPSDRFSVLGFRLGWSPAQTSG